MSKMPGKLCLCSLLAGPASSLFAWCRQATSDIPEATSSPPCPHSWAKHPETPKSLCQEPDLPSPPLIPGSIHGEVNGSRASPFSFSSLWGLCCKGQTVTAHAGDVWWR